MDKPTSSAGFLALFDVELTAQITYKTQVYGDDMDDALVSAAMELHDLIGSDMKVDIHKSIATPVTDEEER